MKSSEIALKIWNKDLIDLEKKLKSCDKSPKKTPHVMVSKPAMESIYNDLGNTVKHTFNSCEYTYKIINEFFGFKSWRMWLERVD